MNKILIIAKALSKDLNRKGLLLYKKHIKKQIKNELKYKRSTKKLVTYLNAVELALKIIKDKEMLYKEKLEKELIQHAKENITEVGIMNLPVSVSILKDVLVIMLND